MRGKLKISAPTVICIAGATEAPLGLPSLWMATQQRLVLETLPDGGEADALRVMDGSRLLDPGVSPIAAAARETLDSLDAFLGLSALTRVHPALVRIPEGWPEAAADMLRAPVAVAAAVAALQFSGALKTATSQKIAAIAAGALGERQTGRPECLAASIGGIILYQPGKGHGFQTVSAQIGEFVAFFPSRPCAVDAAALADANEEAVAQIRRGDSEREFTQENFDAMLSRLSAMSSEAACRVYSQLRLRQVLAQMLETLASDLFDCNRFGELLDDQREICAQYLGVDWEGCADVVAAAKEAGAAGVGIMLSGRTPPALLIHAGDASESVLNALRMGGGCAFRIVKDGGVSMESAEPEPAGDT